MEFPFPVTKLFKEKITKVKGDLLPEGAVEVGPVAQNATNYVAQVVDALGMKSAESQGLVRAVTSADRLKNSDHTMYIMTDHSNGSKNGRVVGFLKTGYKNLYLYDKHGCNHETKPLCVLDFFIHEAQQRRGLGKELFDHMLRDCDVSPKHLALDRPSDSFMAFVRKHYGLFKTIPQVNNYAIYDDFFSKRSDGKSQYPSRVHGRVALRGGKIVQGRRSVPSVPAVTTPPQRHNPQSAMQSLPPQQQKRGPAQLLSQQMQAQQHMLVQQQMQAQHQMQAQQHMQAQQQMQSHQQMQTKQQIQAQQQMQDLQQTQTQQQAQAQQKIQDQQQTEVQQQQMQGEQIAQAQQEMQVPQNIQSQQEGIAQQQVPVEQPMTTQQHPQTSSSMHIRLWGDNQNTGVSECLSYPTFGSPWRGGNLPPTGVTQTNPLPAGFVVPRTEGFGNPMMVTSSSGQVMMVQPPPSQPQPATPRMVQANAGNPHTPTAAMGPASAGASTVPPRSPLVAGGDCPMVVSPQNASPLTSPQPQSPQSQLPPSQPQVQPEQLMQPGGHMQSPMQMQPMMMTTDKNDLSTPYESMRKSKYSHTPLW